MAGHRLFLRTRHNTGDPTANSGSFGDPARARRRPPHRYLSTHHRPLVAERFDATPKNWVQ